MVKARGVYHTGIPVDDMERAERFYTEILGMQIELRAEDEGVRLTRMKCGPDDVVLFERPRPLGRDSYTDDGIYHQAFRIAPEDFEGAMALLKQKGYYRHGPTERPSGMTVYFVDSEGNYQELHAP